VLRTRVPNNAPVLQLSLARRATAEAVGTALLLAGIVGSGIMAERLAGGNVALALLANTVATGGVLAAIILAFGPISGAHFNPAVTLADALRGGFEVTPFADCKWSPNRRFCKRRPKTKTLMK
jgi:glycerol uptake facilitator-like aquaporin